MDIKDVVVGLCGELIHTNKSIQKLGEACSTAFKTQNKINKNFALQLMLLAGYAIYSEVRHVQDSEKINKLIQVVDELKEECTDDQFE